MEHRWVSLQRRFLKVVVPIVRKAPPRAAWALLESFGWIDYELFPGPKRAYRDALARVRRDLDVAVDWDDRRVARGLATGLIHWRCRDRLLDGLSDADAIARFRVEGREHLDAAHDRGRGVVLLGNHFGTHLLPAHWMFRQGYPLRLFMERPRSVSRFMAERFATNGPLGQEKLFVSRRSSPTEAAAAILRASRVLKAGMVLQVASDVRWHGSHTAPGHFLGSTFAFSTTWVILAATTGASVVPAFCRPDGRGDYLVEFLPSFRVPADAARAGRAAPFVQRGLDAIAERVLAHPEQSNEYFDWPRPALALSRPDAEPGPADYRAAAG